MTGAVSPRRAFGGFLVGVLLMQAAWILTMPAFRGSDEFDHVYKAASVARGQWTARDPAPHGRGSIVTVPESIVRAASKVCRFYKYVGHDNCYPIRSVGQGEVQVATAAGSYNPTYYVVVGTLARPFGGAAADFAMRAVSAVLCALLISWAAAVTARWASTNWPLVTLAVGLTPVLVYSTTTAAPNGITYASAALVWASLTGLVRAAGDSRGLVLPLTVGSVALVATHTSGAMWLALIGVVAVLLQPVGTWVRVLRGRWAVWTLAAAVVLTATALCVAWIRLQHANSLGTKVLEPDPFPYMQLPVYQLLWIFQAIGAFPLRNEPAPIPVYVIWGVVLIAVLVALFRAGRHRERLAAAVALFLLVAVPTVLTVMSYRTESLAWQGRYSLPLWLGLTSLAGLARDRRRAGVPLPHALILGSLLATAMTISTVHVGLHESSHGPADPVAVAFPGGMLLVGMLTVLGSLVPLGVIGARRTVAMSTDGPHPDHQPSMAA